MAVERGVLQPLDRAEEEQPLGHRLPVGAHQVDLDVVAAGPVPADRGGGGQDAVRQERGEGFPDQGLDRAAPPARPTLLDPAQCEISPYPLDLRHVRIQKREPEPQVGVGHPVATFLRRPQGAGRVWQDRQPTRFLLIHSPCGRRSGALGHAHYNFRTMTAYNGESSEGFDSLTLL